MKCWRGDFVATDSACGFTRRVTYGESLVSPHLRIRSFVNRPDRCEGLRLVVREAMGYRFMDPAAVLENIRQRSASGFLGTQHHAEFQDNLRANDAGRPPKVLPGLALRCTRTPASARIKEGGVTISAQTGTRSG